MSFWAQAYSKACAQTGSPASRAALMSGAAELVIAWGGEVGSVVSEDRVDLVGDGDDEVEFALRGSNFGDVDMKIADRIGFEFALGGGFAFDLRQPGDPVALQTPV